MWLTLDVHTTDARDQSLPIPANDRTLHDINKDRALGITRVAMLVNRRLGAMIMNCSMRSPLITEEPTFTRDHGFGSATVPAAPELDNRLERRDPSVISGPSRRRRPNGRSLPDRMRKLERIRNR